MRNFILFIIVSIAAMGIFIGLKLLLPNASSSTTPTSTTRIINCIPAQLQAQMNTDVAAGNAYTTVTLKNISDVACIVKGDNPLEVMYPSSVKNLKTVQKSQPITKEFTLAPTQTIYALIHYSNGPQCSSQGTDVNAGVSYKISDKDTVAFKPTQGDTLNIPSCGKETDITTIDLYSFSDKEVLP
jgi:hypothetical protein